MKKTITLLCSAFFTLLLQTAFSQTTTVELITSNQDFYNGSSAGWGYAGYTFFANSSYSKCSSCPGYVAMPVNSSGQAINDYDGNLTRTIQIPSNISSSNGTLTFDRYISTNETTTSYKYDVLTIEITDGITSLSVEFSNLNATSTYITQTVNVLDIDQFAGQTVALSFSAINDGALPTTFRIDDVSLEVDVYSAPQTCVTWANGLPGNSLTQQATEFLCDKNIIENSQDINFLNVPIGKKDVAQYIKNTLFGEGTVLPSDYYPNLFMDLYALSFEGQSAMKMMLYLEFQDGIEPFSRDYFNTAASSVITRAKACRACLEAFNIPPDMSGYNPNSSAPSSFYSDVPVNHKNYGYLQKVSKDGLMGVFNGTCSPSPCINPDGNMTREEFFVLLYKVIKSYGIPAAVTSDDFFLPNSFVQANLGNNYSMERGVFTTYEDGSFDILGGGLPLTFTHYYNSQLMEMPFTNHDAIGFDHDALKQKFNPLGTGWSHTYNTHIKGISDDEDDPNKYVSLLIWWPDGTVHSYDVKQGKYYTAGVTDKLTITQTDFRGNADKVEIKKKDGTTYLFSFNLFDCLKLDEIRDKNGNSTFLAYETVMYGSVPYLRLRTVTDEFSGRTLSFYYQSGTNYLSSVTDNSNRTIKFNVDKDKELLQSFYDAKNQKTDYIYGTSSHEYKQLIKIKRPKGNYVTNAYYKRKLKTTEGNNYKILVDYVPAYTNGWQTTSSLSTINRDGITIDITQKFDYYGNPYEIISPKGKTTLEYTSSPCRNNPTKISNDATGVQTLISYDANCNPTEVKCTANGKTISETFVFNSENQITSYTDPNGNTTTYSYDSKGNLAEKNQPLGIKTTFSYNSNGTLSSVNIPDEGTVSLSYNSYGNINRTDVYSGKVSMYSYDAVSRLISHINEDGNTTNYSYDANDNISIESIDPFGLNLTTLNTYDANDNLITIKSPKGNTTTLSYDANTDALISEQINGFTKQWTYNEDASLKSFTDRNSTTFNFSYFTNGNRKGLLKNDGYSDYDYDGQTLYPISVKRDGDEITYVNDAFGRPTDITYNTSNNTVSYVYDNNNNIVKRTYPLMYGSRLELSLLYDALNRLIEVKNAQTAKSYVKYTYDKAGKVLKEELGNGIITNYYYNTRAQLVKMESLRGTSVLTTLECERTASGKLTQETAQFDVPGSLTETNFWQNPTTHQTYSYDPANRITGSNGKPMEYNSKWSIALNIQDTFTYEYNSNGSELISVNNQTTNKIINFSYDPLKNRRHAGGTNYFLDLLDNKNILVTYGGNSEDQSLFIYGKGLVCRMDPATGGEYYYHYDWKGNTIAISDSAGNLVKGYFYTPFGESIQEKGTISFVNPFTYIGKYGIVDDKNGHFYMRARYYHAAIGRFISEDPAWSTNLFPYADNDPVNNIDPDGEFAETALDIASASYSAYEFNKNPTWANAGMLAWDMGSIFVPFLPGSYVYKSLKAVKRVKNVLPEGKLANHVFSGKYGKLPNDLTSRNLLLDLTNNNKYLMGVDQYGKNWFARTLSDGTQLYGYTYKGIIKGGGINRIPRNVLGE